MLENGIRLNAIGSIEKLPKDARKVLDSTIEKTASNNEMTLSLALSYGGRQEISHAVRNIAEKVSKGEINPDDISDDTIAGNLYTAGIPDPDLLIRTSGEYRLSNFLLWQIAYTEIYITPTLWPDFREEEYIRAISDFQKRDRRYGGTGK